MDLTTDGQKLPLPIRDIAASYQAAVVDVLVDRCSLALRRLNLKDLIIVGGVAKNALMRARLLELSESDGFSVHFPPPSMCTDNAAMVAAAARRLRKHAPMNPLEINAYSTKALKKGLLKRRSP